MKKRLLTGICYLAVLAGFFLLKIYVHRLFFDLLVLAFTAIGTFEMLRAFGDRIHLSQKIVAGIFSCGNILTFALTDEFLPQYAAHITFAVLLAGLSLLFGMLVFLHDAVSLESTLSACGCYLYPAAFLLTLSACNHLPEYSELAILFVFAICPISDSLAFVFGKLLGKKFPRQMAPVVSPNKTVVGGIGGLFGGVLGALAIFFAYNGVLQTIGSNWKELWLFLPLGLFTAIFATFGDLVESAIKRKLDIKDMGKLLPGHGGVLDRIDSSLYASLIVWLVFAIRIMTAC